MHNANHLIAIALALGLPGFLLAAPPEKPTLRIVSPKNGAIVRPGSRLAVRMAGTGAISAIFVMGTGEDDGRAGGIGSGSIEAPGKPPWVIWVSIPEETDPGLYALGAIGHYESETEGDPNIVDEVQVDVEPAEIPPVTLSQPSLRILVGSCMSFRDESPRGCLYDFFNLSGTYPDGTRVTLNNSTRLRLVSQAPSIVKVTEDDELVGLSPGSMKVVAFGKYTIDVTVVDPRRPPPSRPCCVPVQSPSCAQPKGASAIRPE